MNLLILDVSTQRSSSAIIYMIVTSTPYSFITKYMHYVHSIGTVDILVHTYMYNDMNSLTYVYTYSIAVIDKRL